MHRASLFLLLGLSPLLLGGNRQILWAADGLLASFALIAFAISLVRHPRGLVARDKAIVCVGLVFLAVAGWMALQASTFTPEAWHHPIWALVEGFDARGSASLNPSYSLSAISFLVSLGVGLIGVRESVATKFVAGILKLTAVMALCIAGFGVAVLYFQIPTLGLAEKTSHFNQLTGTFANPNNAATYFCFGMVSALVLGAGRFPIVQTSKTAIADQCLFPHFLRRQHRALWFGVAIILFAAVVLTGSRGGLLSAVAGLCVLLAMLARDRSRSVRLYIPAGIVFAAILTAAWLGNVGLFQRADMQASSQVRISLYSEAAGAIKDRLFFGHGAGTYREVEPLYHRAGTPSNLVWDRTHSSYLEGAVDLGLPVTITVVASFVLLLVVLGCALRKNKETSPALLAAISLTAVAVVPSAVDFSLQIQAIATTYAVFIGMGLGDAVDRLGSANFPGSSAFGLTGLIDHDITPHESPARSMRTAGVVAMLASICFFSAGRIAVIELAVSPSLWLSDLRPYRVLLSDNSFTAAMRRYAGAVVEDAYLTYSSAPECREVGFARPPMAPGSAETIAHCLSVIDSALSLAPAAAELWLSRAELLAQQGPAARREFYSAIRNTYRIAEREDYLSAARLTLALPDWENVPVDLREHVMRELERASDETLAAVAQLFVMDVADRASLHGALEAVPEKMFQIAFAAALRTQSDEARRWSDKLHAENWCRAGCEEISTIEITAASEPADASATFRVWVDGEMMDDVAITNGRGSSSTGAPGKGQKVESGQILRLKVHEAKPGTAIEIEFMNDAFDPQTGFDRNMTITRLAVDGNEIPLRLLSVPLGSEGAVSITANGVSFYSEGTARYVNKRSRRD